MTTELDLVHAAYIKQANKIKNDVKKELQPHSQGGNLIASHLFYSILKDNKIELDDKAVKYVNERWSVEKGQINYKEALASVNVNLELNDPLKGKWALRTSKPI